MRYWTAFNITNYTFKLYKAKQQLSSIFGQCSIQHGTRLLFATGELIEETYDIIVIVDATEQDILSLGCAVTLEGTVPGTTLVIPAHSMYKFSNMHSIGLNSIYVDSDRFRVVCNSTLMTNLCCFCPNILRRAAGGCAPPMDRCTRTIFSKLAKFKCPSYKLFRQPNNCRHKHSSSTQQVMRYHFMDVDLLPDENTRFSV